MADQLPSAGGAPRIDSGEFAGQADRTGAHHHGALESVIYVVRGKARMRWGEHLEFVAEADAGDFIFVPPYVPHQEINASSDETLECVLVRSDNEAVVVNLDISRRIAPSSRPIALTRRFTVCPAPVAVVPIPWWARTRNP